MLWSFSKWIFAIYILLVFIEKMLANDDIAKIIIMFVLFCFQN